MQNNNVYRDLSKISKLRTSPSTNALSFCQECYYNKTLCRYAYKYKPIRLRADLPTEPTLRWHRTATAFVSHEYHVNRVYILVPPSALLPALRQL